MQFIGALSGGRTIAQVALNWLVSKGGHGRRNAAMTRYKLTAHCLPLRSVPGSSQATAVCEDVGGRKQNMIAVAALL